MRIIRFIVFVVFSLTASPATAIEPELSDEELQELSTDIAVVKVVGLEVDEEPKGGQEGAIFWNLILTYELEVASVEKGSGLKPEDRITVEAWCRKERSRGGVPDPLGNRPLPSVGQEVRVFLKDGELMYPNGFESGTANNPDIEPYRIDEAPRRIDWRLVPLILVCAASISVIVIWRHRRKMTAM